MILKRLKASFGILQNADLTLCDGLNIIEAPNEAGKSTWIAFIRAMFYGIDTRERDSKSTLADKTRYNPWSGSLMQGTLDCTVSGQDISVERTTVRSNAPMAQFTARRTGSNEPMEELTGENAGLRLLGIPREVYERSAFIRQSGLPVDQDAELERRISALVSTGEENVSYSQVETQLREWLNKRRHHKTGLIPKLDADIAALDEKINRLQRANEQTAKDRRAIDELQVQHAALTAELARHDQLDARQKWDRLNNAKAALEDAESDLLIIASELNRNGEVPPRDVLRTLQNKQSELSSLHASALTAAAAATAARAEADDAEDPVEHSPFSGMDADAAWERAQADFRTYANLKQKSVSGKKPVFVWGIAFLAAFAAALPLSLTGALALWIPIIPLVLLAAGMMILLQMGRGERSRALSDMHFLLQKYDSSDPAQILNTASRYREDCALLEQRRRYSQTLSANLDTLTAQLAQQKSALLAQIHSFAPGVSDEAGVTAALASALDGQDRLDSAIVKRNNAQTVYATLRASLGKLVAPSEKDAPMPEKNREELLFSLSGVKSELQRLTTSLAMTQGALKSVGDPAALDAERTRLEERRTHLQNQYDAIGLALEGLKDANALLQARFSPAINERASEIMAVFTGGKYQKIFLDRKFNAAAEEKDDVISRKAISLSQGTMDQLFLAVRLAICSLVLPRDNPTPLVLDDALSNFDDDRMASAIDFLLEEANDRQIILFTCHTREAAYCKGKSNVNIISRKGWRVK